MREQATALIQRRHPQQLWRHRQPAASRKVRFHGFEVLGQALTAAELQCHRLHFARGELTPGLCRVVRHIRGLLRCSFCWHLHADQRAIGTPAEHHRLWRPRHGLPRGFAQATISVGELRKVRFRHNLASELGAGGPARVRAQPQRVAAVGGLGLARPRGLHQRGNERKAPLATDGDLLEANGDIAAQCACRDEVRLARKVHGHQRVSLNPHIHLQSVMQREAHDAPAQLITNPHVCQRGASAS
mmetsp:Transcript_84617/g.196741  ORF Transcript_84617/g.196741 Transcript_84617/m.196741 type:complete len:244 (+) Transcript_84617:411-1142(+)